MTESHLVKERKKKLEERAKRAKVHDDFANLNTEFDKTIRIMRESTGRK